MMMTSKQATRMTELALLATELGCTQQEALLETLCQFYEAAGFAADLLVTELNSKSNDELIALYMNQ